MAVELCALCGESAPEGSSYCPSCGALLPPREEAIDTLIGTTIADRYEIHALISTGGMGRVYRAEQKMLGRMVAIKIIDPRAMSVNQVAELRTRFMTEARAASRLNHPNVVSVFDFGRTSPAEHAPLFLAMELLAGPTLADVLSSSTTRMPLPRVADILRQTLAALGEAHHLGITHRDIKPSNIVLQKRQRGLADHVSVIDFGVARIGTERGVTERGRLLGTPHYMAPEAILTNNAAPSVDLYAVGVILFEMITGRVPFDDPSAMTICLRHASAPRPDPRAIVPDIPDALVEVYFRALAVDPQGRYPDAQSLAEAISAAVSAPMTHRQASVFPPRSPSAKAPAPVLKPVALPQQRLGASPSVPAAADEESEATALVGRDDVLLWARTAVAQTSELNALVVWGRAGTGRSRLVHEISRAARASGATVIEGAARWGPENEVGYACLRPLLARMSGLNVDDPRLVAGHASDDRLTANGLRELFGSPGITLADEPGAMRPAIAAAMVWAAARAAKSADGHLTLVAIDDIDRVDPISRRSLWDFVRGELPKNLVFLLSSEGRAPLAEEPRFTQREIRGLTRAEASALISSAPRSERESGLRGAEPEGASSELGTEGKAAGRRLEPLYLEQYRRWRAERPSDRAPAGLREIIEARVHELEPAPRRALQAIAVGGAVTAGQIAELVERSDGIEEAVGALIDGGFAVKEPGEGGPVHVAHALYARVALDAAPGGVIDHLHDRAAVLLAASPGDIERRAYHRVRSEPNLETFMLVERAARLRTMRGDDEGAIAALSDGYLVARSYAARGDADANGWHVFGRKLAAALVRAERIDQASGLLLEVLENLGPTDVARAPVLEDLAALARARGRDEDAARWQREANLFPPEARTGPGRARASSASLISQRPGELKRPRSRG